jgi:type I restriction enzyme R subunit
VDKVLLEQIQNDFAADEKWKDYALNNDANTFKLLFERGFMDMAVKRYEQNDAFFVRMFNDGVFMDFMMNLMRIQIYKKLRESGKTAA